ncbi:MAG TPA: HD domain-containing protein, partial [Candidatus Eisenbacteria bacterium]
MEPGPQDSLGPVLGALRRSGRELDVDRLRKAYAFAARAHGSQVRLSGEPYVSHSVEVAVILADLLGAGVDETLLEAAILHDVVEDTDQGLAAVEQTFGSEVAALVDGVTKISGLHFDRPEWEQAENFRKMLLSMARDLRVILIKLADRLHNMRTLGFLDPGRAGRIARETRDIYAPLAHRLGIARVKWELEDLCLKYLDPAAYQEIRDKVALKREERERQVEEIKAPVKRRLVQLGVKVEVVGRPKHL